MLMKKELSDQLKELMDYSPPDKRCKNCHYFVETDISGSVGALDSNCTLHSVGKMATVPEASCKFFEIKRPKI